MSREKLEQYFHKYYTLVFRVAFAEVKSHMDAEDIRQEVFLRLLKYQPEFQSAEHEKAWIIRTAINLCRDFLKSKWKQCITVVEEVPEGEKVHFEHPFLEEDDTLWTVMALPARYRQPLYLFYYEDYTVKEIAELLRCPENTVKTNLRRGREELKKVLIKERGMKNDYRRSKN